MDALDQERDRLESQEQQNRYYEMAQNYEAQEPASYKVLVFSCKYFSLLKFMILL